MPIRNALWSVGAPPMPLIEAKLPNEKLLEDMIVSAPGILSEGWMLIGRQEKAVGGGVIDLLAITQDGSLVLIELKRERTPREVVAQALDYASWVQKLEANDLAAIFGRYRDRSDAPAAVKALPPDLGNAFKAYFGKVLDEESLNTGQQIVIAAASLDSSTERIVNYLNGLDVPINVLFFQVFEASGHQLLSRTWLIDPADTQNNVAARPKKGESEPWNGEFYASFGTKGGDRSWDEARTYGFISAGGGAWNSNTLGLLSEGDRVWVKDPDYGFVGMGVVTGKATPSGEFILTVEGKELPALSVLKEAHYFRDKTDADEIEYFVPVNWVHTVPLNLAVKELGLFGNQNTACRPKTPKWRHTVERLKALWPATA
jgi:hypothetical protein